MGVGFRVQAWGGVSRVQGVLGGRAWTDADHDREESGEAGAGARDIDGFGHLENVMKVQR